ncbi:hypothetical protein BZB76_5484 [Actinomadura pelletieri DSM 43383]|uniref:Uncharacterized protein n=1 Tax=Actinomadura pelletieri DSM 43383 TaxID=1120940 RepID=A0A495QGL0_9ACTN|nr:hypothetical protein [Actinomadura pelletieri]RKS71004.1 hypothetical protein BZB76_5484 [Actinomadura pelletieri DSM 43383]
MTAHDEVGKELRAALAARRELGHDFEPELVESFLDRLDATIESRVDARVEARLAERAATRPERRGTSPEPVFFSMLGGFLTTGAIGGTMGSDGLPAVLLVWIVVAVINVAVIVGGRPR